MILDGVKAGVLINVFFINIFWLKKLVLIVVGRSVAELFFFSSDRVYTYIYIYIVSLAAGLRA